MCHVVFCSASWGQFQKRDNGAATTRKKWRVTPKPEAAVSVAAAAAAAAAAVAVAAAVLIEVKGNPQPPVDYAILAYLTYVQVAVPH